MNEAKDKLRQLLEIMEQLRDPVTGCPWDLAQDFASIAPYTIEEAYEVADAIQRGHMDDLCDELGDLLFQVVFHSQMARESGAFDFETVVEAICSKMVRRHPHVFGGAVVPSAEEQTESWERMKAGEREAGGCSSLMDGIPRGMAELQRSVKLQKRASQVGFDWASPQPVLEKFAEEVAELHEAMMSGNRKHIEEELGDLLFVVTNLARQLKIDPARALRVANAKFEGRFRGVEEAAGSREALEAMSLDRMEALWSQVKQQKNKPPASDVE
jgi:MazG family protein